MQCQRWAFQSEGFDRDSDPDTIAGATVGFAFAALPGALALACLVMPGTVLAQQVLSKDGNIYFNPARSGNPVRVTASGLDREPNLSPDGERIVFVRGTPGSTVQSPRDAIVETTELWSIRSDGSEPRLLLRGESRNNRNGVPMANFRSPQFSPDGRSIYFLSMAGMVSDIAYALDLESGQIREVCGANSLLVVRTGSNAGRLIVAQHRYFIGGGSYDWVWLVDSEGKDIGPLGDPQGVAFDVRLKETAGEGGYSAPE